MLESGRCQMGTVRSMSAARMAVAARLMASPGYPLKFPPLTVGYLMAMGAIFFDISLLCLSGSHAATPTREPAVFLG